MGPRAIAFGCAAMLGTSCSAGVFVCGEDSECAGADAPGMCEANGYCSFPDEQCDSGRRYGNAAPAGIAGSCVPSEGETGDGSGGVGSDSIGSSVGSTNQTTSVTTASTTADATTMALDDTGTTTDAQTTTSTTVDPPETTDSSPGGTTTSGGRPFEVEYAATIAVCTADGVFDPEDCAIQTGADQFTVDLADAAMNATHGWVRFDLDNALGGAEILSVQLVLRVGPDVNDASDQSAEVWSVDAFDLDSLATGNPGATELVAEDVGMVAVDTDVAFDLPPDIVAPGEPVYLGLFPLTTNGVDYRGHASATPPRLVIVAQ